MKYAETATPSGRSLTHSTEFTFIARGFGLLPAPLRCHLSPVPGWVMAGSPKGEVPPALNSALIRGTELILFSRDQMTFHFSSEQAVEQAGHGSMIGWFRNPGCYFRLCR